MRVQTIVPNMKYEDATHYLPAISETGGSTVGNSYLKAWAECPRYWFNTYYRGITDADGTTTRGISPTFTALPLLSGRVFHEGLGAWYGSGCVDGEDTGRRDIDLAISVAKNTHTESRKEYETELQCEEDWTRNEVMLRSYHDYFGPGGVGEEFPDIRVACDAEGLPLVEREWRAQLHDGYIYTCRSDLLVYHRGNLKTMEHKTSAASGVRSRLNNISGDSQFTGEYFVMRECLPDDEVAGIMVNVVVKNRSATSKLHVAERDTTTRTDAQIERWRQGCIDILDQIDEAVKGYEEEILVTSHEVAADVWFPDHGTRTGKCYAYNRECDFMQLCSMAGMEHKFLHMYRRKGAEVK